MSTSADDQEEASFGGRILACLQFFPAGAAEVEQVREVFDALAVVADRDPAILVLDHDFRGARTAGVLQDFDDPAGQRTGEQPVRLGQESWIDHCLNRLHWVYLQQVFWRHRVMLGTGSPIDQVRTRAPCRLLM
jgi:hypothetical protein